MNVQLDYWDATRWFTWLKITLERVSTAYEAAGGNRLFAKIDASRFKAGTEYPFEGEESTKRCLLKTDEVDYTTAPNFMKTMEYKKSQDPLPDQQYGCWYTGEKYKKINQQDPLNTDHVLNFQLYDQQFLLGPHLIASCKIELRDLAVEGISKEPKWHKCIADNEAHTVFEYSISGEVDKEKEPLFNNGKGRYWTRFEAAYAKSIAELKNYWEYGVHTSIYKSSDDWDDEDEMRSSRRDVILICE